MQYYKEKNILSTTIKQNSTKSSFFVVAKLHKTANEGEDNKQKQTKKELLNLKTKKFFLKRFLTLSKYLINFIVFTKQTNSTYLLTTIFIKTIQVQALKYALLIVCMKKANKQTDTINKKNAILFVDS